MYVVTDDNLDGLGKLKLKNLIKKIEGQVKKVEAKAAQLAPKPLRKTAAKLMPSQVIARTESTAVKLAPKPLRAVAAQLAPTTMLRDPGAAFQAIAQEVDKSARHISPSANLRYRKERSKQRIKQLEDQLAGVRRQRALQDTPELAAQEAQILSDLESEKHNQTKLRKQEQVAAKVVTVAAAVVASVFVPGVSAVLQNAWTAMQSGATALGKAMVVKAITPALTKNGVSAKSADTIASLAADQVTQQGAPLTDAQLARITTSVISGEIGQQPVPRGNYVQTDSVPALIAFPDGGQQSPTDAPSSTPAKTDAVKKALPWVVIGGTLLSMMM